MARIQGLLRDLKQYRIDFEAQLECTRSSQCGPRQDKAYAPPVFRAEPDAPDAEGARLSQDTAAKLQSLVAERPGQPLREALLGCQTNAMAVAAAAAVLVVTCTTEPDGVAHRRTLPVGNVCHQHRQADCPSETMARRQRRGIRLAARHRVAPRRGNSVGNTA